MRKLERRKQRLGEPVNRRAAQAAWAAALLLVAAGAAAEPFGYVLDSVSAPFQNLVQLDLATGAVVPIGSLGIEESFVRVVAFAPDGTLYGLDEVLQRLLRIDPATGAAEVVVTLAIVDPGPFLVFTGLTFDACGRLYATAYRQFTEPRWALMAIDPASGDVVELPLPSSSGENYLGLAAFGETLYTDTPQGLAVIDPESGVPTPIGPVPDFFVHYLAFDDAGDLWGYVIPPPPPGIPIPIPQPPSQIFQIDPETGTGVETATFAPTHNGLAIAPPLGACVGPSPLPIPAASPFGLAALVLALAAGGALLLGRR